MAAARASARRVTAAAAADNSSHNGSAVLTVMTWNVQLLAVSVGTPAQLAARAAKLAARIVALSADVVCLQEVFDARARAVLLQALAPAYDVVYAPADAARCGLVIVARGGVTLHATAFHRFSGARGAEAWLFDKGAAGALLLLPTDGDNVDGEGDSDGLHPADVTSASLTSAPKRASCVVIINTHTQSNYWAPSERCGAWLAVPRGHDGSRHDSSVLTRPAHRARAAQALELRAFFGRMCTAAATAGFAVRGALIAGDLNAAAGSPEADAMLTALRAPHTRDLAEPTCAGVSADDASFPLGAWKAKLGAYAPAVPTARLDYILDASAVARADRKPLRHAEAAVERRIAADDDMVLLSDHAAVIAAVALPR